VNFLLESKEMNALLVIVALLPSQCKDIPVIRMEGLVIVNGSFLFESVPKIYTMRRLPSYGLRYYRRCTAWLPRKKAVLFFDRSQIEKGIITEKVFWGEVEVEESMWYFPGTVNRVFTIHQVKESKIDFPKTD
jgi:hypothetical protein